MCPPAKKIKVLHIVGDSKYGGGALVIQRLALMAKEQGWHADVLTTDPKFQKSLHEIGVGVTDLNVIWRDIRPFKDLVGLIRLCNFLRKSDYTIIHTHTSKAGLVGRLASWLARRKVILHTVHGFAFHENSSSAQIKFYSTIERIAAHWCHKIVTVSQFHRDWAIRLGVAKPSKIIAIPNGIPFVRKLEDKSKGVTKESIGLCAGETMILVAGRLAKQKGLEDLLNAVPILTSVSTKPFKITLAGEGPIRPELEAMVEELGISDKVVFLGFRDDIETLVDACDLIVLPSLREGLSISLLEAMAAGKPIVATKIGSNSEATRNGEAAILVPTESEKALADSIGMLINDHHKASCLAKRAKEIYLSTYTERHMLDQYKDLYVGLLQKKKLKPYVAVQDEC